MHTDGVFERAGSAAEQLAVAMAGDRVPQAAQIDGDDGAVGGFDDALQAGAERSQVARAGQIAFSKNAHDVTVFDGLTGLVQGFDKLARTVGCTDGDGLDKAEKPVQTGAFVDGAIHEKADASMLDGAEDQTIHPGDMVGY